MSESLRRNTRRLARFGVRHLTCRINRTYLYARTPGGGEGVEPDAALSIRTLDAAEIDLLTEVSPIDREMVGSRLARGDTCYIGCLSGRIAHFSWTQRSGRHSIDSAGHCLDILAGHLWIYHCQTVAWARGRRIYPAVLGHVIRMAGPEFREIWIYTTADNVASQRGILRAGFETRGQLAAFAVGQLTIPISPRSALIRLMRE